MKKVPQRSSHSDKIDNHRFPICSPEPNHLQIRSGNNPSTHIHLSLIHIQMCIRDRSKIECLFCTVLYFFTITSITYLQLLFQILPLNQQNDLVHTLHTLFSMQHSRPNQSVSLSSNTCSNVSLKSFLIRQMCIRDSSCSSFLNGFPHFMHLG